MGATGSYFEHLNFSRKYRAAALRAAAACYFCPHNVIARGSRPKARRLAHVLGNFFRLPASIMTG